MLNGSPVAKCNKQTKQTVISGNNNSYEKKNSWFRDENDLNANIFHNLNLN